MNLNLRHKRAIASLAVGMSQQSAARSAQVSVRTLQRWLDVPEFQQAIDQQATVLCEKLESSLLSALEHLAALSTLALAETLSTPTAEISPAQFNAKTRAANVVLTHLLRHQELTEVIAKIAELEAQLIDEI